MNIDRRRLLKLIPLSSIALAAGCGESDEDKVARVERALAAHQQGPVEVEADPAKAPTPADEPEDKTKKLILFAAANLSDPFQRVQSALMKASAQRLDGCVFKELDAGGDAAAQLKQLNQAQAKAPAFLVVSPVDDKNIATAVAAIRAGGAFVVGVDERLGPGTCSAVVCVKQRKLGTLAGQLVVDALKRKAAGEGKSAVTGRVIHLVGDVDSFAARERAEGFREALKAEPGIIVVHEAPGGWSREGGKARTEEALRLQHEFDVVCAHNDEMAQGASEALSAAQVRDRVLIAGMDGGLELVRRSVIDATILQPMPLQFAFELIRRSLADPHLTPPARTELEPQAVTPVNLDDVVRKGLKEGGE